MQSIFIIVDATPKLNPPSDLLFQEFSFLSIDQQRLKRTTKKKQKMWHFHRRWCKQNNK